MNDNYLFEKHINKEIKFKPHKESDAGIGYFYIVYVNPDELYGKRKFGIYFGKYLLSYDSKSGWSTCDFYATGCGG